MERIELYTTQALLPQLDQQKSSNHQKLVMENLLMKCKEIYSFSNQLIFGHRYSADFLSAIVFVHQNLAILDIPPFRIGNFRLQMRNFELKKGS